MLMVQAAAVAAVEAVAAAALVSTQIDSSPAKKGNEDGDVHVSNRCAPFN